VIKVVAAGVNRADLLQRQGYYPPPPGASPVIGLEVSGVIDEVGADVTGWSPGDPAVALLAGGGYAEFVAVPAGQVLPPPDGIDLVSAAGLIEVAATVVSNFDHVHLAAGETVLVHGGTGGIGTFAIQYARAIGARVLTTAGSPAKLELCRDLGADVAIDYRTWAAAVANATSGEGVDVILDVIGAKDLEVNVNSLATPSRSATGWSSSACRADARVPSTWASSSPSGGRRDRDQPARASGRRQGPRSVPRCSAARGRWWRPGRSGSLPRPGSHSTRSPMPIAGSSRAGTPARSC